MGRSSSARRLVALVAAALMILTSLPQSGLPHAGAGAPIYPDLQAGIPPNIKLRNEPAATGQPPHWLLRFDGITENHGGLLEVVADLDTSRDIYQQVYDQRSGGAMVRREKVSTDLIFHPSHDHFHVSNLAEFQLLKRGSSGVYQATKNPSAKTSFCILDTIRIDPSAPPSTFSDCNSSRQGLTAGWADVYGWYLPEQFIDLGTTRPADGEYAIQQTVDPLGKFLESDDANNTTTAFFSIVDGQTYEPSDQPFCSASPSTPRVGDRLQIACEHLSPGVTYDLYWSSPSSAALKTTKGDPDGRVAGSFIVPMATSGVHTVFAVARGSDKQLTTAVTVRTTADASHTSGPVGSRLTVGLTGLSAGETVTTHMDLGNGTSLKLAQRTAKADGSSLFALTVPSSTAGAHTVTVTTSRTRKTFRLPFVVSPSLTVVPESLAAGSLFYPQLRGFGGGETVSIAVQAARTRVIRRLAVFSTGGLGPSSRADVRLPADLPTGTYTLTARGQTTGALAYDHLVVSGTGPTPTPTATATTVVSGASEPSPMPTAEATVAETATAEPTATGVASPIPIETPAPPPATSTAEPTPSETATAEPTATPPPADPPPAELTPTVAPPG